MRRSFLALLAICGCLAAFSATQAQDKLDDNLVLELQRSGGFVAPKAATHYRFTVAKDGTWEFKANMAKVQKGKLTAEEVRAWVKTTADGGVDKLKSNEALGAADEPFMVIMVRAQDKATRVKIALNEKLAATLDQKVLDLAKPGK